MGIYFSSYTTMSRGVMVLLNNNFEQKVKRIITDKNGKYIILDMVIKRERNTISKSIWP